jgi:hypothetical protein
MNESCFWLVVGLRLQLNQVEIIHPKSLREIFGQGLEAGGLCTSWDLPVDLLGLETLQTCLPFK